MAAKGQTVGAEGRKRMKEAAIKRWADPAERERMGDSRRGKTASPETSKKMSIVRTGKVQSEETVEKHRQWMLAHPGHGHGSESCEKRSVSRSKRVQNDFRCPTFYSEKTARNVRYRSSYELCFFHYLEHCSDVLWYEVERLMIPYTFEGKSLNYVPDVRVHWKSGIVELVEVSASWAMNTPKKQAKLAAAGTFCLEKGWEYRTVTESYLGQLISSQADLFGNLVSDRKVQRLLRLATQANESSTSARQPQLCGVDDIVRHSEETRRAEDKEPLCN